MKLQCEDHDRHTVMSIKGELIADDIDRLRREVLERLESRVHDFVLDLSAMEFIDSNGLETLMWMQDQCADRLGQVRLAACRDNVQKILEITRLAARFDRHDDVDSAVKGLG